MDPIENGDIPASYVSLPGGICCIDGIILPKLCRDYFIRHYKDPY